MQPFNIDSYTLTRKEDNTIVRVDTHGVESPELPMEYFTAQIATHTSILEDLEAQKAKLDAFELANPTIEEE